MKKVDFMLTAFRDGFQSVFGARVFSSDYLPVVEEAAAAGITHIEAGGGAMFQAPFFYCNENSFEVMDKFRSIVGPNVNLQTLSRGINVVGLDSQPRDMIKLHAELFKKHGMTTIRNFDALNDVNNLIYSGQCIVDAGLNHEVVVAMMELPPGCNGHTVEFYETVLRRILDSGITYTSLCFKDASGTSTPQKVYETIKMARKLVGEDVRIAFHSHETAGCSVLAYKAALDGGANQIDLAMAPVSGGTCQPDVLTMWHALRGTEYDLGVDINKIVKLEESFQHALKDYFIPPEATQVCPIIPFSPMPGGALTANTQMLRDNGLMDKFQDIIVAMNEVVAKGGFGTSVTPVSQFYFQQAFNNVMFGPWKKIAEGYGKMVLGYFGNTPTTPDAEVIKIAAEQLKLEPTTRSPLDINDENPKKGRKAAETMLKEANLPITEENVFIAASCAEKGILFLKGEAKLGVRKNAPKVEEAKTAAVAAAPKSDSVTVTLNGKAFAVKFSGNSATVNGRSYDFSVADTADAPAAAPVATGKGEEVRNTLPGVVIRLAAKPGDTVKEGDLLLVLEAMKMETLVTAPVSGVLAAINVTPGQQLQAGTVLAVINC